MSKNKSQQQASPISMSSVPFPPPSEPRFTFVDLFAGIGGFRLALQSLGGACVFSSEWNAAAAETYASNFGEYPYGDITLPETKEAIPSGFDILTAGFPCQAFSIAGLQKGFADTRGTLFFDIEEIVARHRPKAILLENVKNLVSHDGGKTFGVIIERLERAGYTTTHQVLNTSHFGIPQNRERIYIVAIRSDLATKPYIFPTKSRRLVSLFDILEPRTTEAKIIVRDDIHITKSYGPPSSSDSAIFELPNRPIQIGFVNKGGQGERIYSPYGHSVTLSAYGGGVGAKTGLYLVDGVIRKLSPRECARLQGFPDSFVVHSSASQAYKQFGNSVSVPVVSAVASNILQTISIM